MAKERFSNHTVNTVIIVVLALLFIGVIYFPKRIWDKEAALANESHFRMNAITQAERLFYILGQAYTDDPLLLGQVVNNVLDSVQAAANDTLGPYTGYRDLHFPAVSIPVEYSDEYRQKYLAEHKALALRLHPHHFMQAEKLTKVLDSVKTLHAGGNFTGIQELEIDSIRLVMDVPEKFDIMYQNIKTLMFNALTNSFTPDPKFSNPLVDAVLDSLEKNPNLQGRIPFTGLYSEPIHFAFAIPTNFGELITNSKLKFKQQLVIDSIDSAQFGDTLYTMALDTFLLLDTADVAPQSFVISYVDTFDTEHSIAVEVNRDGILATKNETRNLLYKALTGYNEPGKAVAEAIIAIAQDSLEANPNIMDSVHVDLDLSEAVFSINVHRNIPNYRQKIARDNAYFKLNLNLADIPMDSAAVEIVSFIADTLQHRGEFMGWQIVPTTYDTFFVEVDENFMRRYDNMNMRLYENLTGKFKNVHTFVEKVVMEAQALAAIDSLDFTGSQVIEFPAETLRVFVPEEYQMLYDSTFVTFRDTVVQVDDSTFTGVWERGLLAVTDAGEWDSLGFFVSKAGQDYGYNADLPDSVRDLNIFQKADTSLSERAFWGENQYVVVFNEDSLAQSVFRIVDEFEMTDSIVVDSLNVISPEFVVGPREKGFITEKDSFFAWLDTSIAKKYTKKVLVSSYYFDPEFLYCTVTGIPYRVTVRNKVNLTVESPIVNPIKSRRYLFFSQVDSSHGRIIDGEASWLK